MTLIRFYSYYYHYYDSPYVICQRLVVSGAVDVAINKTDKVLASFCVQGSDTLIRHLTTVLDQTRLSFAAPNS